MCFHITNNKEFHRSCDGETRTLNTDIEMERVVLNNGIVMPALGLGY